MQHRRLRPRWTTIGAVALGAAMVVAIASTGSADALQHSHRRNHHHGRLHASSQPGLLQMKRRSRKTISQNWSGYVATGGTYTSVSGSWRVPAVDCSITPNAASANWVGLDGAGSSTVEQTGTFSECDHGAAQYAPWFEAFPAASVVLTQPVSPGDVMQASVTATGGHSFTLVLTNQTRGWTSTNPISVRGRGLSAEAIAEAPSVQGQVLPLANFGTTGFTGVTVNGQPLAASAPTAVTMAAFGGNPVKASPGPLSGGDFSVTWLHP